MKEVVYFINTNLISIFNDIQLVSGYLKLFDVSKLSDLKLYNSVTKYTRLYGFFKPLKKIQQNFLRKLFSAFILAPSEGMF